MTERKRRRANGRTHHRMSADIIEFKRPLTPAEQFKMQQAQGDWQKPEKVASEGEQEPTEERERRLAEIRQQRQQERSESAREARERKQAQERSAQHQRHKNQIAEQKQEQMQRLEEQQQAKAEEITRKAEIVAAKQTLENRVTDHIPLTKVMLDRERKLLKAKQEGQKVKDRRSVKTIERGIEELERILAFDAELKRKASGAI